MLPRLHACFVASFFALGTFESILWQADNRCLPATPADVWQAGAEATEAALYGLGGRWYAVGNIAAAVCAFERASQLFPEAADAFTTLGSLLVAHGCEERALSAMKLEPN